MCLQQSRQGVLKIQIKKAQNTQERTDTSGYIRLEASV